MNSEKVKEIKKVLEQNTKTCLLYDFEKNTDCKVFQCKYILDYINELESENEKLKQHKRELQGAQQDLISRIAELEKENQSLKESIEYGNEVCKECQSDKDKGKKWKLKQFAERLKEKVHRRDYVQGYAEIGLCEEIDETLKEFINVDK